MNSRELVALSARAMLAGFRQGSLDPEQVLDAHFEHIAAINSRINALAALDVDGARADAQLSKARWKAGTPAGLLDGLPIGAKDLQQTKGLLTTFGSPRSRSHVPPADMPMVARLREAGAIVLAKTNVPEMGAGRNTRNPVWGATGNPFDPRLTVGGSSGGSAAALASNLLPLCAGSDTDGSLRLPAAMCGIVGYRPSTDVIAHPTRPLGWSAISVQGPMARNMDDLVLMLRACDGADQRDPLTVTTLPGRFGDLGSLDTGSLRLGFSEDFGGAPVDPAIRETFRARLEVLAPHVAEMRSVDLDLGGTDRVFDIFRAESFGAQIRENVFLGQSFTLADRAWAHSEQTRILRRFHERIAGLASTSSGTMAVPAGRPRFRGTIAPGSDRLLRQAAGSTARPSPGLPRAPRLRHGSRSPSCRLQKARLEPWAARPMPGADPLRRYPRLLRFRLASPLTDQPCEPCFTFGGKNLGLEGNISHLRATPIL